MTTHFPCPYFGRDVDLTEERERHVADRHPDLLPDYRDQIRVTLANPDEVRRSKRFADARLFSRWAADVRGGRHIVVVVVSDITGRRDWIITAYMTRALVHGEIEWQRS